MTKDYNRFAEFCFQVLDRACPHVIADLPIIRSLDKEGYLQWYLCWFNLLPKRFISWIIENMKWEEKS